LSESVVNTELISFFLHHIHYFVFGVCDFLSIIWIYTKGNGDRSNALNDVFETNGSAITKDEIPG
jgi:hypothetical protein